MPSARAEGAAKVQDVFLIRLLMLPDSENRSRLLGPPGYSRLVKVPSVTPALADSGASG